MHLSWRTVLYKHKMLTFAPDGNSTGQRQMCLRVLMWKCGILTFYCISMEVSFSVFVAGWVWMLDVYVREIGEMWSRVNWRNCVWAKKKTFFFPGDKTFPPIKQWNWQNLQDWVSRVLVKYSFNLYTIVFSVLYVVYSDIQWRAHSWICLVKLPKINIKSKT